MTSKALNRRLVSTFMACVVCTASLASAQSGGQDAVSNFYDVSVNACDSATGCVFFSGHVQEVGGVLIGDLAANVTDFPNGIFFQVSCTGPEYAAAIRVNAGGAVSVRITLDPAAPDCSSLPITPPSVITIDLTGHPDGKSHTSIAGIETDTFDNGTGTITVRLNTQTDCYSETFAGTVISPFDVVDLQGNACIQHRVQR